MTAEEYAQAVLDAQFPVKGRRIKAKFVPYQLHLQRTELAKLLQSAFLSGWHEAGEENSDATQNNDA